MQDMNNEVKNRVSELLNGASKLLAGNGSTAGPSTSVSDSVPSSATLQESLRRANNMLRQSTSSGLCRSLNRQERLQAAAGATYQRPRQGNEKSKKEKKAIEFALLRCFEDDEVDEPNHLKARDLGGPRKEWIRLMNTAIKEKFFDNRLQEYRPDEYYFVGIMIGIALLQNSQLPMYMPIEVIDKLVTSTDDSCITNIQRGLDVFGLEEIICRVPILLHLLRPTNHTLAPKMLLKLLTPQFSEEGSSAYLKEKKVYALFVKYVREVGSGRRAPITLSSVLIFTTGAAEAPVLGFAIQPCIRFVGEQPKLSEVLLNPNRYRYLPTAHTCTNVLLLPIGTLTSELPETEDLFQIYDVAFANTHFGVV
ncbi:uncharacterized protein [Montipora foliosa]|uniref:uncharacterized protein n=1 Tax=Montipora foliosa TaxID=591990 RepID=UPI0035F1216D